MHVNTRYFYNSKCTDLVALHSSIEKKKRRVVQYVKNVGCVNVLVKHRKGKSSTKRQKETVCDSIVCSNRFDQLYVEDGNYQFSNHISDNVFYTNAKSNHQEVKKIRLEVENI